jgi:hypothetical protein
MTARRSLWLCAAALGLAGGWLASPAGAAPSAPANKTFADEPAAHQLYTRMVDTMRKATTLSWTSDYRWEADGKTLGHATYQIWLKKPNYARMEAMRAGETQPRGILVGDGDYFWIYWPQDKLRYPWERTGKYAEEYEKYQHVFYEKQRTPLGQHSLGHASGELGVGIAMTILDPSTFHGYSDSLQGYVDGVRALGVATVGGEECDQIEVSIMKHQRSWYLWLARKDHLPRQLKQVVRVSKDIIAEETWTGVTLDAEIAQERFVWSPPAGWKQWHMPRLEEGLLKPGTLAPDFELTAADGSKLKLSNFRGKIVWLNKWRCG